MAYISVDNIMKFLTFKAAEVAPHTLKTYVSGLAYLHRITKHFSWDKEVGKHPAVLMLLKNTVKMHKHNKPTQSQHLTHDMLKLIRNKLDLGQEDHLLLWTICTVAFHTMARLSELVAASANDTENVVTLESVRMEEVGGEMGASILLPRSKTHDPAVPAVLCIDPTGNETCPLVALSRYLLMRHGKGYAEETNILFCYRDNEPVTRNQVMNSVHHCLPGEKLDARSFRSGGATHWVLQGMPDLVIQREGRWSTNAFQRYIRYTVPVRRAIKARHKKNNNGSQLLI